MSAHDKLMRPVVVFLWLAVLTLAEIGVASLGGSLPHGLVAALLVVSALAKAAFVALFFMHLRIEGRWIWGLALVPVAVVFVLVLGLVPDIAIGYWR